MSHLAKSHREVKRFAKCFSPATWKSNVAPHPVNYVGDKRMFFDYCATVFETTVTWYASKKSTTTRLENQTMLESLKKSCGVSAFEGLRAGEKQFIIPVQANNKVNQSIY